MDLPVLIGAIVAVVVGAGGVLAALWWFEWRRR